MFKALDDGILNKDIVGGKAANLSKMFDMELTVPQGFVVPINYCFKCDFEKGRRYESGSAFSLTLDSHIRNLCHKTGKTWNESGGKPLLVSVRSGAPISMPGMMDTILNVGLTKKNLDNFVEELGATTEFGLDCYRRLIQMYGVTVKGIDPTKFSDVYNSVDVFFDRMNVKAYETMVEFFEDIYKEETGEDFPEDPNTQLLEACNAVFLSWYSDKAVAYRSLEGIPNNMGTAVTVQEMVFGNLNDESATGVAFSHDPNSGRKGIYGDFLKHAQGEDVVAGTHTVSPIAKMFDDENLMKPARELQAVLGKLFKRERDILDIEFTIENKKLYLLQYRVAKRSNRASIRSLLDMNKEGIISADVATEKFLSLLPTAELSATEEPENLNYLGKGLGATEGLAFGRIVTTHEQANRLHEKNEPFVYVATETNPEDVVQMKNSVGILTAKGGKLSHAAVVARGWNKPCVVSFEGMTVTDDGFIYDEVTYTKGDIVKINGASGEVWVCQS